MTEEEFRNRYLAEIPTFNAYGKFINQRIINGIEESGKKTGDFIKIPSYPRVKEIGSVLSKAFFRNKNYEDPYLEITDKVGVRFVVLVTRDIEFTKNIIEKDEFWNYSKDRDFEEEREKNPLIFEYQSVHYILRNKESFLYENIQIPKNTPCEVQIRTLLQHAYSELTHDTIYKPQSISLPEIIRPIARSMALIETTDNIFNEVQMTILNANKEMNDFMKSLIDLYKCILQPEYEPKMNYLILDAYRDLLKEIAVSDIDSFLTRNSFLHEVIKSKTTISLLYRQPIILFLYFLIKMRRNVCKNNWPLTDEELRPLFTDLGIAFERN